MFFSKYPHRSNFVFASRFDAKTGRASFGRDEMEISVDSFEGDVYRVSLRGKRWTKTRRVVEMNAPAPAKNGRLSLNPKGELVLEGKGGKPALASVEGGGIGVMGDASMFQFTVPKSARFYGMGEKTFGRLELSGLRARFWNTDVWSDFHWTQWAEHPTDPPYFSTPYLIVQLENEWVGLLLDNPYPAFMETPGREGGDEPFVEWQRTAPHIVLGNDGGEPTLWLIVAGTLRELTQKLQKLVGTMPVPPIWSMGYHQSRWGYAGESDLLDLDAKFNENNIPCDALWLDIDYMDGFRLFTYGKDLFPDGAQSTAKKLAKSNRKIVPIIDPGLKQDPGYEAYADGSKKGLFCLNPEGQEYIGLVWPGETVYPDFSLQKAQRWWAERVKNFVKDTYYGCWVDMNDPSTGPVDPMGMRFNNGREPHEAHRNQYALGMQKATFEGFLKAHRNKRPFILSRSGFTGTSRYAAIWTGDNVANYAYLKMSIPTSLNLSLSGVPMNGPDIGGFGGDTTEGLITDWIKACFLFPFFRNHNMKGARDHEPWTFSKGGMGLMARYIRMRYKLMPYLYNLFADHEASGEPVLRPLNYEFEGEKLSHEALDTQFMVGSAIMQAPILDGKVREREVALPGKELWFEDSGEWTKPGSERVKPERGETPLYFRCGSLVPMQIGLPRTHKTNLRRIEVHVFGHAKWEGESEFVYRADDGESYNYRRGKRTEVRIRAKAIKGELALSTETLADGYGQVRIEFVLHDTFKKVTVNGASATPAEERGQFTGRPFTQWRVK